jgi:hypothetical protein
MLALSDSQLRTVRAAADRVPAEKRGTFVDRVVARLQRQRGFTDADLDDAARAALTGLVQSAAYRRRAASRRRGSSKIGVSLNLDLAWGAFFSQSFIRARACNSASSRDPNTTLPFISTPAG